MTKVLKSYKGTELLKLPMLKVAIDYFITFFSVDWTIPDVSCANKRDFIKSM